VIWTRGRRTKPQVFTRLRTYTYKACSEGNADETEGSRKKKAKIAEGLGGKQRRGGEGGKRHSRQELIHDNGQGNLKCRGKKEGPVRAGGDLKKGWFWGAEFNG